MSAKTSLKISREQALGRVMVFAMSSDENLKALLNTALADTLYNCYMIVSSSENDDQELPPL